jgi:hypothetical protein
MNVVLPPKEQDIRTALIQRAEEFSRQTGMSKTEIGKLAVNDGAFLAQVADGRNFTIKLYQRVMDWLDKNWPEPHARRPIETRYNLRGRAAPAHRRNVTAKAAPAAGHFSRFSDLRADRFRTAAEIEHYVNKLRDEWSRA